MKKVLISLSALALLGSSSAALAATAPAVNATNPAANAAAAKEAAKLAKKAAAAKAKAAKLARAAAVARAKADANPGNAKLAALAAKAEQQAAAAEAEASAYEAAAAAASSRDLAAAAAAVSVTPAAAAVSVAPAASAAAAVSTGAASSAIAAASVELLDDEDEDEIEEVDSSAADEGPSKAERRAAIAQRKAQRLARVQELLDAAGIRVSSEVKVEGGESKITYKYLRKNKTSGEYEDITSDFGAKVSTAIGTEQNKTGKSLDSYMNYALASGRLLSELSAAAAALKNAPVKAPTASDSRAADAVYLQDGVKVNGTSAPVTALVTDGAVIESGTGTIKRREISVVNIKKLEKAADDAARELKAAQDALARVDKSKLSDIATGSGTPATKAKKAYEDAQAAVDAASKRAALAKQALSNAKELKITEEVRRLHGAAHLVKDFNDLRVDAGKENSTEGDGELTKLYKMMYGVDNSSHKLNASRSALIDAFKNAADVTNTAFSISKLEDAQKLAQDVVNKLSAQSDKAQALLYANKLDSGTGDTANTAAKAENDSTLNGNSKKTELRKAADAIKTAHEDSKKILALISAAQELARKDALAAAMDKLGSEKGAQKADNTKGSFVVLKEELLGTNPGTSLEAKFSSSLDKVSDIEGATTKAFKVLFDAYEANELAKKAATRNGVELTTTSGEDSTLTNKQKADNAAVEAYAATQAVLNDAKTIAQTLATGEQQLRMEILKTQQDKVKDDNDSSTSTNNGNGVKAALAKAKRASESDTEVAKAAEATTYGDAKTKINTAITSETQVTEVKLKKNATSPTTFERAAGTEQEDVIETLTLTPEYESITNETTTHKAKATLANLTTQIGTTAETGLSKKLADIAGGASDTSKTLGKSVNAFKTYVTADPSDGLKIADGKKATDALGDTGIKVGAYQDETNGIALKTVAGNLDTATKDKDASAIKAAVGAVTAQLKKEIDLGDGKKLITVDTTNQNKYTLNDKDGNAVNDAEIADISKYDGKDDRGETPGANDKALKAIDAMYAKVIEQDQAKGLADENGEARKYTQADLDAEAVNSPGTQKRKLKDGDKEQRISAGVEIQVAQKAIEELSGEESEESSVAKAEKAVQEATDAAEATLVIEAIIAAELTEAEDIRANEELDNE